MTIEPRLRKGRITVPHSKSHEQRLLIADFLAGDDSRLVDGDEDSDDVRATKRCLRVLRLGLVEKNSFLILDCGESGATRRFLGPIAAALDVRPVFKLSPKLSVRPQLDYDELRPGEFELAGDVSSQFVTGLLFALPLLKGDSQIRFTSPLQSQGYVEMTNNVLQGAGITIFQREGGFDVPGGQAYHSQPQTKVEGDWSGAAFWYAMNALGSEIEIAGLDSNSAQPDRVVGAMLDRIVHRADERTTELDVSQCPDLFPVLSVVAAATEGTTVFRGTHRLRHKESDRVASMSDVVSRFGGRVKSNDDNFVVEGRGRPLAGGKFSSFGDHRVAMSIAVGATVAESAVTIDDIACAAKSYPSFFPNFDKL